MHSDLARTQRPRSWSLVQGETVILSIDGKEIRAPKGMLLIEAAERNGVYIPRFCWHNRMQPVAMCRMCLVQIEGMRGLPTACTVPVAEGMKVDTSSDLVQKAQEGVLEFLLINHPLDCPVCDRGGECPLQDQTLVFGPGESRFVEEKRHYEKPIPISDLVMLDRERCILCARCTRFSEEISGDPLIDFIERGSRTQVLTFPDEPFASYFSGNTVQICPVGALTATPYRFRARPWDLDSSKSTCTACSVGCRMEVQSSSNRIVRHLGIDSEPVNQSWLCDKGRFGFEFLSDPERVTAPMVRDGDGWREVPWPEALDLVADRLRSARPSVAVLGGGRGTNESAWVLARFARDVLGTGDVDAQMGDGLAASLVAGIPEDKRGTIGDLETADCVVLVAPDLKEELPVLYLRVFRSATALGATLVEIHTRDTGLSRVADHKVRYLPGEGANVLGTLAAPDVPSGEMGAVHAALRRGRTLLVLGRANLAEDFSSTAIAALRLVEALPHARVLPVVRRGNTHGAIDAGCVPDLLPGRVRAEHPGLDAAGILRAAAAGEVAALLLVGSDPLFDFPDQELAERALLRVPFVVALDLFVTQSGAHAAVLLPVAGYAEQDGTVTNVEGRITRVHARVTPPGKAQPDWMVLGELASRLGADLEHDSAEAITALMCEELPSWRDVKPSRLGRPPFTDGALAAPGPVRYEPAPHAAAPPVDAYGVRIVSSRTLYDDGVMVSRCPSLARLAPAYEVHLNPRELERLGLSPGGMVVVKNGKGSVTLPVREDSGTPEGVAFLPFPSASALITAGEPVTEARLETPK